MRPALLGRLFHGALAVFDTSSPTENFPTRVINPCSFRSEA